VYKISTNDIRIKRRHNVVQ